MSKRVELCCSRNDTRLALVNPERSGAGAGYFEVRLSSTPLSASVLVYELQPRSLGTFFREIASDWRGWKGEKQWESLEGQLAMIATSDSLGHVELVVKLSEHHPGWWNAETSIGLEAGALSGIAKEVEAFVQHL